ncbi:MAG: serine/threonine protein kinase, partial [Oscillospiraceae bacterium]|nr:serine/threonine protein kinase [Oscillospiraceae bacterium]
MEKKPLWPGWETVRLIGRGSFGAVYEIERDMLGEKEKPALKVKSIPENSSEIDSLRDEGYDDASITGTFKEHLKSIVAEYALMRKLNGNTNVVNCDDVRYVQHDDGFGWDIFIKMELLTPMKKALSKTPSDGQVARLGADICRALTLCKNYSIVHRDIKPDNIFVSDTGDCKLGDFGIARTMEKTSGGTKIGTYEYMAPEVYHGKPYGSGADIYSLGLVLYWLLNERRLPFLPLPPALPTVREKEEARLRRFSGEALPAPAHGGEELKRIVLKACAYDPKDRYQSAAEMLRDLEALGAAPAVPVSAVPA